VVGDNVIVYDRLLGNSLL